MGNELNSFGSLATLTVDGKKYQYHSLQAFAESLHVDLSQIPFSLKILLENLLRREDGVTVRKEDIEAVARWDPAAAAGQGDPVHAGAHPAAGLHRRAGRRRSGRHARGAAKTRWQAFPHQPPATGRPDHRPLGAGGPLSAPSRR